MNAMYTMDCIPTDERPRERLLRFGAETMSTTELIAIILGSGTKSMPVLFLAQQLMIRFRSLEAIVEASIRELCEMKGMGTAKAIQLKAALSLGLRAAQTVRSEKTRVTCPSEVYLYLQSFAEKKEEHFIAVFLDTRGGILSHHIVSIGTLSEAPVHPREVYYAAIREKAASLIVAHNHPSGDVNPSEADYHVTKQLVNVGHIMQIPLQDHIIISKGSYFSFRNKEEHLFCNTNPGK